jgi:NitT/TauT family transport system substrate-binding protein
MPMIRAVLAGLVALTLVLPACGAGAAEKQKISILLDWVPHGAHAGLQLAKQKGWFDAEGLDADILDGKGSTTTIQQLATGQVDFAFAQLGAMAAAVSNGLPVISVMGFVRGGDNGIAFPAETSWKTLKDLAGKKIALPSGSATATFFDAFLQAGGVSRDDYTIVNVDSSAEFTTYTSGFVDAAVASLGVFMPLVNEVRPSRAIFFSDVGLVIPGYGLVVRKSDLAAKAETIRKVVAVNKQAWDYIFAGHEEEAVDAILAQRDGLRLDRKVMLGQLKAYMPFFYTAATKDKPIGWQAESDWVGALKAMQQVGMVKPEFQPADFYTNRFIPG